MIVSYVQINEPLNVHLSLTSKLLSALPLVRVWLCGSGVNQIGNVTTR